MDSTQKGPSTVAPNCSRDNNNDNKSRIVATRALALLLLTLALLLLTLALLVLNGQLAHLGSEAVHTLVQNWSGNMAWLIFLKSDGEEGHATRWIGANGVNEWNKVRLNATIGDSWTKDGIVQRDLVIVFTSCWIMEIERRGDHLTSWILDDGIAQGRLGFNHLFVRFIEGHASILAGIRGVHVGE